MGKGRARRGHNHRLRLRLFGRRGRRCKVGLLGVYLDFGDEGQLFVVRRLLQLGRQGFAQPVVLVEHRHAAHALLAQLRDDLAGLVGVARAHMKHLRVEGFAKHRCARNRAKHQRAVLFDQRQDGRRLGGAGAVVDHEDLVGL
ncbi:hypothetical protein D3C86_1691420 [compost metagenome]